MSAVISKCQLPTVEKLQFTNFVTKFWGNMLRKGFKKNACTKDTDSLNMCVGRGQVRNNTRTSWLLDQLGWWVGENMFYVSHIMCHMSFVTCLVSHVMCHMSCVKCHVSHVMCHMSCVTFRCRLCAVWWQPRSCRNRPSRLSDVGTRVMPGAKPYKRSSGEWFYRCQKLPRVMVNAETAIQGMQQRIWQKKLMTAKKILKNEDSVACNIYKEELDIYTKLAWTILTKRKVLRKRSKKLCSTKNYLDIKADMKRYKKLLTSRSII